MNLKEQFRQDVEKFGYTVFMVSDKKDPSKHFSTFAFLDCFAAWRVYNSFNKTKSKTASYVPVSIAKESALSSNCDGFGVYDKDAVRGVCENDPQCHFYEGFVTGWFEGSSLYAKNGISEEKEKK